MTTGYALNGYAILTARDTWTINVPGYSGVCRGLWWPLDEVTDEDESARMLSDELQDELLRDLTPEMPLVSVNEDLLRKYAVTSERLRIPLYGLLCASPVERPDMPGWLRTLHSSCTYLGIDISYPNGSYSFLNAAYLSHGPGLHQFLRESLNDNGLLSTVTGAQDFLRRYQAELDKGASFEILSNAIPIELWLDSGLRALKGLWSG